MLIVKKFGGTSVGDSERIRNVARRCAEEYKKGNDVVVVLSAMEKPPMFFWKRPGRSTPKHPKESWICFLQQGSRLP